MDSWIWQPGYPLVHARLDGTDVVLTQQRFAFGDTDDDTLWLVPVLVRNGDESQRVLLEARLGAAARSPIRRRRWSSTPAGAGSSACPTTTSCAAGSPAPRSPALDTLERYGLVDDAWNEVVAGRLDGAAFLSFVEGFGAERDLAVWQAIVLGLRGLGRTLDDADYPRFQARVAALLRPVVAELGDPTAGEDDLRGKLRGTLTATLAVLGDDAATVASCREQYEASRRGDQVHPELVAAATAVVAATGDADDYERLLDGYRTAATPQDQLRHLYALADFDDEALVLRTCELCLTDEVKTQNAPFLLRMAIANRHHGFAAWSFVRQHWAEANAAFPANTIVRMVGSVSMLTTEQAVADVQSFFTEHPIPQGAKTLDQTLERQRVNAALRERERVDLAAAL